jgi:FdhE protein
MEAELKQLRERAKQLKEKRPGYEAILDFYVQVREAQVNSKAFLERGAMDQEGYRVHPAQEGLPLISKGQFPIDIKAATALFHRLCRLGKKANPHMAVEVEKIQKAIDKTKIDLQELLTGGEREQKKEKVAVDWGLDQHVLNFLIENSLRPSIETGRERLGSVLEPESWRKSHCPICGSRPALSLLKGEGGKRYSLCSYCGYEWRKDRLSCSVCGNKEQASLTYFCGQGEEAFRIDFCDACHHYIKTIDYRILEPSEPGLEDLATLHLDVLAVQKGYTRAVPNPWST